LPICHMLHQIDREGEGERKRGRRHLLQGSDVIDPPAAGSRSRNGLRCAATQAEACMDWRRSALLALAGLVRPSPSSEILDARAGHMQSNATAI
jgi:hypothetical protein